MPLRPVAFLGALVIAASAACGASGEVKVNTSGGSDDEAHASSSAAASGAAGDAPTSAEPVASRPADAPPAAAGEPAPAAALSAPACPLVCNVAHKGRAAPADEARLTTDLGEILTTLRSCGSVGPTPSLTLRFDSTSALTGFGVDAERGNEGACVDAVRERRPTVTYQGPATLRCSERCGADARTAPRTAPRRAAPRRGRR